MNKNFSSGEGMVAIKITVSLEQNHIAIQNFLERDEIWEKTVFVTKTMQKLPSNLNLN